MESTEACRSRLVDRLPLLFGMLATLVALAVLFVPSAIGVADNGDELRVACPLGLTPNLAPGQDVYFHSAALTYRRGPLNTGVNCDYRSTAAIPMRAGEVVSRLLPGRPALDLRVMGVFYAVLLGVAVAALVAALPRRQRLRIFTGLGLVAVVGDVAFVPYFSSGYSEPLGLVGALASIGLLAIGWRRASRPGVGWLLITTTAILATVGAKPQYGPLALVFAPALLLCGVDFGRVSAGFRSRALPICAAVVVVAVGGLAARSSPMSFQQSNRYNAFFFELLGHSPNPAADLREFRLPPTLARFSGSSRFAEPNASTDPGFAEFSERVNYKTLGEFYATHPSRTVSLLARGFRAGADPRDSQLGNFRYAGGPDVARTACRWCLASAVGHVLRPASPFIAPIVWLICTLLGVVAVLGGDRERRALGGAVLLSVAGSVVLFLAATFGEGSYELTKHLQLSVALGWTALVLSAALAVVTFSGQRTPSEGMLQEAEMVDDAAVGGP